MREVLQRLLRPTEPPRRFGEIESVLLDGRYIVVDDRGRRMTVDGPADYLPGNEVVVQNNRIVGLGRRRPATKTIKV